MCICACRYMCIFMCMYTYTYIYTDIYLHTQLRLPISRCICVYRCICTHMHAFVHTTHCIGICASRTTTSAHHRASFVRGGLLVVGHRWSKDTFRLACCDRPCLSSGAPVAGHTMTTMTIFLTCDDWSRPARMINEDARDRRLSCPTISSPLLLSMWNMFAPICDDVGRIWSLHLSFEQYPYKNSRSAEYAVEPWRSIEED